MKSILLTRTGLLGVLILAISTSVWGADQEKLDTRFYVTPMASFAQFGWDTSQRPKKPDVRVEPENKLGLTITLGKVLNPYFNAEIYYFGFSQVADANIANAESSREGFGLAGLFFPFRDTFPVYALFGVGFGEFTFANYNLADNEADAQFYDVGIGVMLPVPYIDFGYNMRIRAEYRYRNIDVEFINQQDLSFGSGIASIGLVIPLGPPPEQPEPEPKPKPEPKPEPQPEPKPPQDSDHDGVLNKNDACPNTPSGAEVNLDGCTMILLKGVTFRFGSATLTDQAKQRLKSVANALKIATDLEITLVGHTDSKGSAAYNLKLSKKRARSVKQYLVELGIDASRITTKGKGESEPIAPNTFPDGSDNPEGRAKNRRVELHITNR